MIYIIKNLSQLFTNLKSFYDEIISNTIFQDT
jgi:hypothetical protein